MRYSSYLFFGNDSRKETTEDSDVDILCEKKEI